MTKLNLGSGTEHLEGWTNVDADPDVCPDVVANVLELPFADESVEAIFASHILEHIPCDRPVLEEWQRVLVPGGQITVVVPNPIAVYFLARTGHYEWQPGKPIDVLYINASVFGGHLLGGKFATVGHVHNQVFLFDMLEQLMRRYFVDVHETCGDEELREGGYDETWVVGRKANGSQA